MTKLLGRAYLNMLMVLDIQVIGIMMFRVVMVLKLGLIMQNTKAIMRMVRNTVSELSNGQMDHHILENS